MALPLFQNDTMRILWMFHQQEPAGGAVGPGSLPLHDLESRGIQSLYLVQRADQDAPSPEETIHIWEIRNPATAPPAPGDTLYWCRIVRLPALTDKHHLIRVRGAYNFTHRGFTNRRFGSVFAFLFLCQWRRTAKSVISICLAFDVANETWHQRKLIRKLDVRDAPRCAFTKSIRRRFLRHFDRSICFGWYSLWFRWIKSVTQNPLGV